MTHMAQRDPNNRIALFSDVPGDEEKVRAILADWGLAADAIKRLVADESARPLDARPCADNTTAQRPPAPSPRGH
jgi:hypothetical protein